MAQLLATIFVILLIVLVNWYFFFQKEKNKDSLSDIINLHFKERA